MVQIDSTDLDVKVLGDDGQPTSVELTAMVDVATRSIIAAVIRAKTTRGKRRAHDEKLALFATPRRAARATKAVDASLLLARALVPAPMRPGFSALAHASASDLPFEELLEADPRMAQAASRPVIVPDLIVIDHGTCSPGGRSSTPASRWGSRYGRHGAARRRTRRSWSARSDRSSRCSASM
ncbi:hypothetical protein [Streptomyces sp. N1]|uniref:hypothetical protein n=1 Tax=Streptomyces sp. N1 TaxID=576456 RepID=UPI0010115144|nr:hypothetical protein [Streptomyces sp. N1]